jgi:MoaA/NifB/PqqE/SkfB family radical SAM enzyme
MRCLSIHLTDLCNSRCSFCVVGAPLMTADGVVYDEVVAFLRENAGRGFNVVNLHGGEPTAHPRFLETLALIRELGYPETHVQTNGIRLANLVFVREAIELGVSLFIVSLHGDCARIQDEQTRTPGGFAQTIAGIGNAIAAGAQVRTNTVVMRTNLEQLRAISKLASDLGVNHLNFSNLHPGGSAIFGLSRTLPAFAEIRQNLYPAADLAIARGRRVTLEGFPYCVIKERLELHLDNEYRDILMLHRGHVFRSYEAFMDNAMRTYVDSCERCTVSDACGGVYQEYVDLRGSSEFAPIVTETGKVVLDNSLARRAG